MTSHELTFPNKNRQIPMENNRVASQTCIADIKK
jgi:hypothetical protein